ncbi:helix-turn-helix domain-containing protein [Aureimonas glaciei]|uniref:Helix-turn-helix domain-containing protein n=1 Tax=Aureimonas glaciei TaxID=1776957 RepID=A0A917DJP9_9HYPH|nr:helix-turn-helix domain-containing protein [Aureimonas glaciei]GGD42467.1 hypothetical protein GCM10011335_51470 [Aureimonas glaciei]
MSDRRRDVELRGAKQIAHECGVSERTIRRWVASGNLSGAKKLGGKTSPLRMNRDALKRFREGE